MYSSHEFLTPPTITRKKTDWLYRKMRQFFDCCATRRRNMRRRDAISLFLICAMLIYCLVTHESGLAQPVLPNDSKDRVQKVNTIQRKLCLLKIDVASAIHEVDKYGPLDINTYEVGYTYHGDVDVIIDLAQAQVVKDGEGLIVRVPEPELDYDTRNLILANLKCEYRATHWWITNTRIKKAEKNMLNKVQDDIDYTCWKCFPKTDAKFQAERLLRSLYAAVGCDDVRVEIVSKNPDVCW